MSWLEHSYCKELQQSLEANFSASYLTSSFHFPRWCLWAWFSTFKLHWPWVMHRDLLQAPESKLRCRCQIHYGLSVYPWYSSIGPQPLPHEMLTLVLWFISETKSQELSILCETVLWWQDPSAHGRHGLWDNSEWESSWKEDTKWKWSHIQL